MKTQALTRRLHEGVFNALYSRSLVYNTCWEDPAVDRQALGLRPSDTMVVITSAGCNVLDYALTGVGRIHSVDANPRQTALLELKIAAIRRLDFDDFFELFGHGRHRHAAVLYRRVLRRHLSPFATSYWDRRISWFCQDDPRDTFYCFGLSGVFARVFRGYLRLRPRLRQAITEMLACTDLATQREIYDTRVDPLMWSRAMNWALSRQLTMSMLGVPHPQTREVELAHADGVAGFIREAIRYVFRTLPVQHNYFWRLYLHGRYTRDCCPEYLREENFDRLKSDAVFKIEPHTATITAFLRDHAGRISRFVLLDHMDWMASHAPAALAEEWQYIFARMTPDARLIFRSAHADPAYLHELVVPGVGRLQEHLSFDTALAHRLNAEDRVHTYAGFHIASPRAT